MFTNPTRDHLDYHGDSGRLRRQQRRLFHWQGLSHAVINVDDPFGCELVASLAGSGVQVFSYGLDGGDITVSQLEALAGRAAAERAHAMGRRPD